DRFGVLARHVPHEPAREIPQPTYLYLRGICSTIDGEEPMRRVADGRLRRSSCQLRCGSLSSAAATSPPITSTPGAGFPASRSLACAISTPTRRGERPSDLAP